MFENLSPQPNNQNNQSAMPSSQPEPEDIFAGTEKELRANMAGVNKPPQFQPKTVLPPTAPAVNIPEAGGNMSAPPAAAGVKSDKKYVIIGVVVIIVLALILLGMIALAYYKARGDKSNATTNSGNVQVSSPQTTEQPAPVSEPGLEQQLTPASEQTGTETEQKGEVILDEITDSDGDGLMDGEERRLGTNLNNSDSDGDGLFDREEVRVYKTDPLNPDTDGDGYRDGDEVRDEYNPNGPGKLFELPQ